MLQAQRFIDGNRKHAKFRLVKIYSKPFGKYFQRKETFFLDNEVLLDKTRKINDLFADQPSRFECKLCSSELKKTHDLEQHGVKYIFCDSCNHLNGMNHDTLDFVNAIYIQEGGAEYSKNYVQADFLTRASEIYRPKLEFLMSALKHDGIQAPREILDVGSGSGHFVFESIRSGIPTRGIDVNSEMVRHGNTHIHASLGTMPLELVNEDSFFSRISQTEADVISAIGVIEHLRNPGEFFSAFIQSRATYVFYSVPMFSLSVLLENVFNDVFPRQLGGGHTHLFTEKSISHLNELFQANPISEWRFGTDIMDMIRSLEVTLKRNGSSDKTIEIARKNLLQSADSLQSSLDKNHFCSEIHVVAKKISEGSKQVQPDNKMR